MKRLLVATALIFFVSEARPASLTITDGAGATQHLNAGTDGSNLNPSASSAYVITNPTSTLTLPATTTAYAPGQLIASSATAGSVVVPSFTIPNTAGGFYVSGGILTSSDLASTAYPGTVVQIDLWRAAPTFTNGNLGAYAIATGAAGYLGSLSCTLVQDGDGAHSACAPTIGTSQADRLDSGTSVFWTMQAVTASGALTASKVFTFRPGLSN